MSGLRALVCDHRIILTCGTGGVGKTTMSAALGLAAAMQGRRVLVLTVDPARRLADALGINLTSLTPTRVWPEKQGLGDRDFGSRPGFLDALMLDAKRTFDRVIERYAPDPATAQTILTNPLYHHLSSLIAGSQEYMAMEKLYEMATTTDYDLIIVDTPPTSHAVDLLRAPQRLIRALTDSMLRLFLKPSMLAGKLGAKILAKGADMLMMVFGRMAGVELMQEIADLLMSTVGLFGGFQDRADAVRAMLQAKETICILVTTPQPTVISDAIEFVREVRREGLRLGGAIVNRVTPSLVTSTQLAACATHAVDPFAQQLLRLAKSYQAQEQADQACIAQLRKAVPKRAPLVTVPLRAGDITDREGLRHLADMLIKDQ